VQVFLEFYQKKFALDNPFFERFVVCKPDKKGIKKAAFRAAFLKVTGEIKLIA
jgi:hypothetical protein